MASIAAGASALFAFGAGIYNKACRTIKVKQKGSSEGQKVISPDNSYNLSFTSTAWTYYWCDIWPWGNDHHVHFPVHTGHEDAHNFEFKSDGVYKMDTDGRNYHLVRKY